MARKVKVKGHRRSDGTKVKGHKRTILSKRKEAHSKLKGSLARAIRMGTASAGQLRHLKDAVSEARNEAGMSRAMGKYRKKSRKHKARSDARTHKYFARQHRRTNRKRK